MNSAVAFPVGGYLPRPVAVRRPPRVASADAVRKQLAKICASDGFVHARRMRTFLEFVVEETLAGRAAKLCEYSVGISVFGRDESFEPGLDPIVRNDARRLRQKLLEYYQQSGQGDPISIFIPKGGYIPVFRTQTDRIADAPRAGYRLAVTLTRIADQAQIWATEQEVQISEQAEEDCFALQVHLRSQKAAVTMLPISRSSGPAHRWRRSPGRAIE